jgi:CheY-like chemotaxis protein
LAGLCAILRSPVRQVSRNGGSAKIVENLWIDAGRGKGYYQNDKNLETKSNRVAWPEEKGSDAMASLKMSPSSVRSGASAVAPTEMLTIVVVGQPGEERALVRSAARKAGWRIQEACTYREAMAQLCREKVPVIICNSKLPDGTWEDVLSATATQTIRPRLIVASRHADEHLWADVLNMGGFDVLSAPFADEEICRSVEMAWRNWRDEVQQESWRRVAV